LEFLEIVPDFLVGQSLGELACAFADGCLTLQEAILASYYRGVVSMQTTFIPGAMAVIGKGTFHLIRGLN